MNVTVAPMVETTPVSAGVPNRLCVMWGFTDMDERKIKELKYYERIMTMKPRFDRHQPPTNCQKCEHHQPRWKYRFCYYTICPYNIRDSTFRREPLKKEHFPQRGGEHDGCMMIFRSRRIRTVCFLQSSKTSVYDRPIQELISRSKVTLWLILGSHERISEKRLD